MQQYTEVGIAMGVAPGMPGPVSSPRYRYLIRQPSSSTTVPAAPKGQKVAVTSLALMHAMAIITGGASLPASDSVLASGRRSMQAACAPSQSLTDGGTVSVGFGRIVVSKMEVSNIIKKYLV